MKDFIKISDIRKNLLEKSEKDKKILEEFTKTKIEIEDDISIEGEPFDVYQTKQILKAFGRGFEMNDALDLLEDEYGLEVINLVDFCKTKERLKTLKGRIIGTEGKTKNYIEKYCEVKLSIFGKTVSIIGRWEKINIAREAVMKIFEGKPHQSLYRWLERLPVK